MAAILAVAASDNWNSNGSWVGGVQPTAADDVTIVAGANVTIPTGVTALARSVTIAATGTVTFATTTSVLTIGDGTAGAGSVAFSNAGTVTLTGVGTINFISTSATVQTLTSGGVTLPNITINGSGNNIQLADNLTTSGNITRTAGTLDFNSKTVTMNGASKTFAGGGLTYTGTLIQSGSGAAAITGANSFTTYTRTPTAVKTDSLALSANQIVTGTCTLNSNSLTNRLLVQSNTLGTPRTITAATLVATNVIDFRDITGAGAATWTTGASGATYFGDCGGNSGITVTPSASQTATATTSFSISDVTKFTSRVPLPQDDVVMNGAFSASQTITVDMPRCGRNWDLSAVTGAPSFIWASLASFTTYGNITMASNVLPSGSTTSWNFEGRGSQTITNNSVVWQSATRVNVNSFNGTYTQTDATNHIANNSPSVLQVTVGTFSDGGFNITSGQLGVSSGATYNPGNITFTANGTSNGNIINISSGATFTGGNMTIVIPTRTVSQTLAGGNKAFKAFNITGGTGVLTVTGNNTFTNLPQVTGGTQSIIWPGGGTTTFTNGGSFGNGTNVLTFTSSSGSSTLSFGTQVNADYLNLTNIIAAGTTPAYAGANSTNGGGNTNWLFSAAPSSGGTMLLMGV